MRLPNRGSAGGGEAGRARGGGQQTKESAAATTRGGGAGAGGRKLWREHGVEPEATDDGPGPEGGAAGPARQPDQSRGAGGRGIGMASE